jgi:glycosyltransferase involved in cell wall biosynthesis
MPPVSVIILTLNEQANIRDCLASCAWSDDICILDSGSTDRTVDTARELGAAIYFHPFESFARQRNWAIDNIPVRHDWIFHLDADERFTPELVAEMQRVLSDNPSAAGFYVPSKLMFMGRWLKRSGRYPVYQMRLFHRARMRFCDYGHGQREHTTGRIETLREPYLHYNLGKGLDDWIEKHNRYSTLEATNILATRSERLHIIDLLSSDAVRRRRAMKRVWYRLPLRPWLRWAGMMFVSGGIFEGSAARTYASMAALYERMIDLKVRHMESKRSSSDEASALTPPSRKHRPSQGPTEPAADIRR